MAQPPPENENILQKRQPKTVHYPENENFESDCLKIIFDYGIIRTRSENMEDPKKYTKQIGGQPVSILNLLLKMTEKLLIFPEKMCILLVGKRNGHHNIATGRVTDEDREVYRTNEQGDDY